MVKKLRNKFVLVTTLLMVVVFGGFLVCNMIYNSYWNRLEMIEMLDWIADSGIFNAQDETTNTELIENATDDNNPIVGIVLDKNYKIIKKQVIGNGKEIELSDERLQSMVEKKDDSKLGKYYYSYRELDNDQILLVIMDSSTRGHLLLKILGTVGLLALGIFLLILVTIYLSKFVTKPAEESLMREKRFISDASHELKTPLGAISINAQAIQLSSEDNLYINNIVSEADRMNRLIEKLLILSKLDEAPKMILEEICLSDLCEEMALTYESVAFEKGVEYIYDIDSDIYIKGNADDIRQLIAVLIDNALKNTEHSGKTVVKCTKRKKQNIIEVSNTGEGINQEDLPHVFERFYTSDKSRKNNSFGLGLAIAKAIVEMHNGTIMVECGHEHNTIFRVQF